MTAQPPNESDEACPSEGVRVRGLFVSLNKAQFGKNIAVCARRGGAVDPLFSSVSI